jgi:hypothetical protein
MTDSLTPVADLTSLQVELVTRRTFVYVRHLQDRYRDSVGFLPTMALHEYQNRRQLWLARENGSPCGYLAWGSFRGNRPVRDPTTIKIIQACIDYQAQRLTHATQLVHHLERLTVRAGIPTVSLWCADDLPANQFWSALGYVTVAQRTGGSGLIADRQHSRWIRNLDHNS